MIDLRKCTVLVNDETEYKAIAAVAKRQGFYWANSVSLDHNYCTNFPTRLRFDEECGVHYNSSADYYERNYQYKDIVSMLGSLILKRKEGQLC